jgi:hypothetical protein
MDVHRRACVPLAVATLTAALVAAPLAQPADAVTVGFEKYPPMHLIHFNHAETKRIANAANTGFTPFLSVLCGMIPGGKKTLAPKAACAVGTSVSYGSVAAGFQQAAKEGRCYRIAYPVAFPMPMKAFSRPEVC